MARKLDFDNLSDDDFQYLSERTWLISDQVLSGNTGLPQQLAEWRSGAAAAEDEGETITYAQAKVEQLRAELERRGLDTAGKKDVLIARLEEDDADEDEEEDDNIPEED